jgi:hypothetical protein
MEVKPAQGDFAVVVVVVVANVEAFLRHLELPLRDLLA